MELKFMFLAVFLIVASFLLVVTSEPSGDKKALLDFARKLSHSHPLNWDAKSSACRNWSGVTCNHDKSRIIALRLPGFGFSGQIPFDTLSRLSALQLLSLRSNSITGPFPSDLAKLRNLTALYLQSNTFYGFLPWDYSVWKNLSVIDLSNNAFNGSIPSSLSNLTHLTSLYLANNSLSGELPDFNISSLQVLDLSDNNLTGVIPQSFHRFPSSSFLGNHFSPENLPIPLPPAPTPKAQPSRKSSKLGEPAILGIAIGSCVLAFVIIAVLLIVCYSTKGEDGVLAQSKKKETTLKKTVSGRQDKNTSLVFFENCNLAFDLEDLLRASAEVLGKGTYGTTYKAALEDSTTVVVKRLKEGSVARREFEQQMEVVGSIKHENVAALRAYYYSKDEKLVVYDYYSQGSVWAMLHVNRGQGRTSLDWKARLGIAVGAATGIAHIHTLSSGKLVHGNIKASNIFLNSKQHGCVCDLGLATIMSPSATPMQGGYRAPEVTDTRKVSQASDVYSFGVLIFELLTGKSPIHTAGGDEVIHLVRWVHSVVREEWTAEVFDLELLKFPDIEEEMVEMLQIGMACASRVPEQRPKMSEVVKMVEDIRRTNAGTQPVSATISEGSTPTFIS
ncbi:putative inactive receptor kinase [Heracleum sosnowskyi]|uniref:Inactive receptor kinase n=1 Tax=Heracleum sosnowskyi TaxID=360622 RepID=A0AAD8J977_9APIA|nr:putative inactive receptor kinase [Heracleum sosnowskyi]